CLHDISVTQCHALDALNDRGALTLNDLSAALFLEKSTVSRAVQDLEDRGYVVRRPHPTDGRAVLLEASPTGVALSTKIE
ncbi:MAG: MarR family transcriptional regulator, partial [Thermoplasmata archaeon]|nr:MarR family transcriptional regulator [Thermoplasmata archaeon]NIU50821.1 MarR family transcriptional regulator [Thermoplasmata archaeon]NIV80544.1 MarR family transcriptional regulator [Thermoplasmata archaeon]NIW84346.1 MarR family transcriptional regulator [Thermoplasmata archaeon]NIW90643.1 MarR family transcriptional regulator [Thermoplasmata archaeon]